MVRRIVELRCAWGFVDRDAEPGFAVTATALLLDAELVTENADGSVSSEIVCRQRDAWPMSAGARGFSAEARRWLVRGVDDWDGDVENLPGGRANEWAAEIALRLRAAMGAPLLEELHRLAVSGAHLRMCFTAVEPRVGRIPIETLAWRDLTNDRSAQGRPSVLRVGWCDEDPGGRGVAALSGREPGLYRIGVFAAAGSRGDHELGELFAPSRLDVENAGRPLKHATRDMPGEDLTSFDQETRDRVVNTDLAIVVAHGAGSAGLDVGVGDRLEAPALVEGLRGGPAVVVLAACGSAMSGDLRTGPARPLAEHVASAGTALVIGLQGDVTRTDLARDFVRYLMKAVEGPAHARATLLDWERHIEAARECMAGSGHVVVAYAHSSLLAARRPTRWGATSESCETPLVVRPWYVPGQIVCFEHPEAEGHLRLPLPVDAGVRLEVAVVEADEDDLAGTAVPPGAAGELRAAYGLGSLRLRVRRTGVPPAGWAVSAAELSAVIRALCELTGRGAPASALRILDARVAVDWGAHDAAPRIIGIPDGQRVTRFPEWPVALRAEPVASVPEMPSALLRQPPLVSDVWHDLCVWFANGGGLPALVERQAARTRQLRALPAIRAALMDAPDVVALPGAARLSTDPVGVRLPSLAREDERAAASSANVPDILR